MNTSVPGGGHGHHHNPIEVEWRLLREFLRDLIDAAGLLRSREKSVVIFVHQWMHNPAGAKPTKATATNLRNIATNNPAILSDQKTKLSAIADKIEASLK